MAYKFLLVVSIAVFAFVQINGLDTHYQDEVTLGNDAEKFLEKLREAVDKAMVQAQQALDDAAKKVNETADTVQAAAVAEMQSTEHELEEEIDALKEKAANAGVNIDDCLAGNEEKLVNLPNTFSDDMVHCVSDRIIEGISYAQDALNKVQTIVNEVENLKQEIKDCGSGLKAVKCLAKLAVKIEKDITSLPTEIEADVAKTVLLISQLDKKIEDCASTRTDECEAEGKKIVETVAICVAGKII